MLQLGKSVLTFPLSCSSSAFAAVSLEFMEEPKTHNVSGRNRERALLVGLASACAQMLLNVTLWLLVLFLKWFPINTETQTTLEV